MALTERLALVIEATAGQAVAEFKKVGAQAKTLEGEVGAGTKSLSGLGQAGTAAGGLLKAGVAAAAAGAGAAIVKFGVDSVNAFVKTTDEIRHFNLVAGTSAEQGSKLVALAHTLGISTDDVSRGMGMLGKNIDANKDKLRAHGIEIAYNAKGNVDLAATLLNVGDAWKATDDPAKRAGLAAAAFGRNWQTLSPILGKSREEIEAVFKAAEGHGLIFSQEQLDKGKEFGLATRELGEAWKGVEVQIGETIVPFLTELAVVITKVVDATHGEVGPVLKGLLAIASGPFAPVLIGLGKTMQFFGAGAAKAAHDVDAASQAIQEQAVDADALSKSLYSLESAHRSVDSAVRAEAAAERDLADKEKALSVLRREGAVDEKAVAAARKESETAERDLAKSRSDLEKATANVADAERALNEAIQPATVEALTAAYDNLKSAQLDVTDAQQSLNDATDTYNKMLAAFQGGTSLDPASTDELAIAQGDVNDAQEKWQASLADGKSTVADVARAHKRYTDTLEALDKLQKRGVVTEAELGQQHEKVERATISVDGANQRATTAQTALNDAGHKGAENDPLVAAAHDKVTIAADLMGKATQGVADAINNVTEKHTALGTALAGDPNYDDKVRKARQDVADATQHVADAEYNVAQQKAGYEAAKKVLDDTISKGGSGAVESVRSEIQALLDKKPELAAFLDPMLADLHEAANTLNTTFPPGSFGAAWGLNDVVSAITGTGTGPPKHAAGGVATKATLGIFGEAGPEALVPLDQWQGGKGGGGTTVVINVDGSVLSTDRALGDLVHSVLLDKQSRTGNLGIAAA